MIKLLVIADDFTGALDTAVQFSQQGIRTLVSTQTKIKFDDLDEKIEILVIDTESRHLNFERAYNLIKEIIVSAKQNGLEFIYKKVDSALRGNIAAEVKALLETSQTRAVPFLPAYPEMNRVLIDGDLYINEVLVSESIFADDPYEPVKESNLLKRLKKEADIDGQLIKDKISDLSSGLLVFDAKSNEDLERHARNLKAANLLSVSIGCAGFAKILAKELFPDAKAVTHKLGKSLVVICGSINPITQRQIEYAEEKNYPRISLNAQQLLENNYWKTLKGQTDIRNYLEKMKESPLLIFETLSHQTSSEIEQYAQENQIGSQDYRFKIGGALGELTESLWTANSENTFLFTGGDTLYQSMQVLGIKEIKPLSEISRGVVLSEIQWQGRSIQVITKSGGFGDEYLFEKLVLEKGEKEC
ncbi:MAG: four-carbon acid sugar kinase family protein [Lactovum sp.]